MQRADGEMIPRFGQLEQDIKDEPSSVVGGTMNATASKKQQIPSEVYLVSKEKFHATTDKELQLDDEQFLNSEECSMEGQAKEAAHRFIQSRVR
jgi:hypothetical protein